MIVRHLSTIVAMSTALRVGITTTIAVTTKKGVGPVSVSIFPAVQVFGLDPDTSDKKVPDYSGTLILSSRIYFVRMSDHMRVFVGDLPRQSAGIEDVAKQKCRCARRTLLRLEIDMNEAEIFFPALQPFEVAQ